MSSLLIAALKKKALKIKSALALPLKPYHPQKKKKTPESSNVSSSVLHYFILLNYLLQKLSNSRYFGTILSARRNKGLNLEKSLYSSLVYSPVLRRKRDKADCSVHAYGNWLAEPVFQINFFAIKEAWYEFFTLRARKVYLFLRCLDGMHFFRCFIALFSNCASEKFHNQIDNFIGRIL